MGWLLVSEAVEEIHVGDLQLGISEVGHHQVVIGRPDSRFFVLIGGVFLDQFKVKILFGNDVGLRG